ncbi:MAG: VanW family protein [Clostridia bacterium]|nr:VanW family protein [Clostridia bacterium]
MAGKRNSERQTHTSARRKRALSNEESVNKATKKTTEKKAASKAKLPNKGFMLVGGAVALVIVLFLAISSYVMYAGDRAYAKEGTSVLGIDVGGKNAEEIVALLNEKAVLDDFTVVYNCEGESETVTAQDVALVLDAQKTAEAAVTRGRSNIFSAFASIFTSKEIVPIYTYDVLALSEVSASLSEKCGGSLKQHEIHIEEDHIRICAGEAGTGVDPEEIQADFEEAILSGGGEYTLSLSKAKPLQVDVEELYALVYCEPADAHYTIEGKEVTITPEVNGKSFDKAEATRQLSGFGEGSEDVVISLDVKEASVKAEDINKTLFADVLGKYSTKYMTSNKPRANNVELAARYVDGTILLPGDEFSYNNIVGPRTYERGFKAASVYENNKMVDGLGGGICQTSSTIYAAVLYADLEVTERHEHSLEVHYIDLGIDATVAYGTLDFRFKNNTTAPIKIVAKAGGGTVNVQILGTNENPDKKVEIKTDRISFTPHGTTTVNDPTLPIGQQKEDAEGFNGAVINTYKIISENGKQISNKLIHKSTYRMANRVVRVGVDPNAVPADPSVVPTDPNAVPVNPNATPQTPSTPQAPTESGTASAPEQTSPQPETPAEPQAPIEPQAPSAPMQVPDGI